jgi:DamX protein
MAENDTFMYHEKKPWLNESKGLNALKNQERTRKLELITHLLANSEQALIVCGLESLDKTNFLNDLKNKLISGIYSQVQAKENLTFDQIQEQAVNSINPSKKTTKNARVLSSGFSRFEHHHQKLVLVIDNAGHLAPGLINALINYAIKSPFLRVIFILTHDELDLKNNTDNALLDCCLIEIESHLKENSDSDLIDHIELTSQSQHNINEVITENYYLDSQLIPGQMLYKIPAKEGAGENNHSLKILIAGVVSLIALALVTQWYSASKYNLKDNLDTTAIENSSQPALPIAK